MENYSYKLADTRHDPIRNLRDLKACGFYNGILGFYLNGKAIGSGELVVVETNSVHTDAVALDKEYRRKGHGVHLYKALIRAAKKIGARRIYSSKSLNRFSRRMWSEKLSKIFKVKESRRWNRCRRCGNRNVVLRYYIDLR